MKIQPKFRVLSISIALLLIWELIIIIFKIPKFILPSPIDIFIIFLPTTSNLIFDIFVTLYECIMAIVLSIIIGTLIAIMFITRSELDLTLTPFLVAMKSIPAIALAPIIILWFGFGMSSKIVIGFLIAVFPVIIVLRDGMKRTPRALINIMKIYKISKLKTLVNVIFPNSLPYFFSALKVAFPLSLVGVIVGEFIGAKYGLGYTIVMFMYYLKTPQTFVVLIWISIIGIVGYKIIEFLEHKICWWQHIKSGN